MTSLILKELGSPAEIALRIILKQGLSSKMREAELKKELCELVEEVTVKFVGFFATKSVKSGLRLTLDIVSMGLEHETGSAYQPDVWASRLQTLGFKGMAVSAFKLFKSLAALPAAESPISSEDFVEPVGLKQLVLNCFLVRDRKPVGYAWYRFELNGRLRNLDSIRLMNSLVRSMTGEKPSDWVRKQIGTDGSPELFASTIVNSVFLRAALGLKPGLSLTYDEFDLAHRQVWKTKGYRLDEAKRRFEAFVKKRFPPDVRRQPDVAKWFKTYFLNAFRHAYGRAIGIGYFRVTGVPESVDIRIEKSMDWTKDVPRATRLPKSF